MGFALKPRPDRPIGPLDPLDTHLTMTTGLPPRLLAALFALGFVADACGATTRVGVLVKGHSDFWSAVENGARAAGERLNVEVEIKEPPTETDVAAQLQMFDALVDEKVDAIVVAPTAGTVLAEHAQAAAAKGIRIIVIDTALPGVPVDSFVGTNQRSAGETAGRLIAGMVGESDEISVLRHDHNGGATAQREVGALMTLGSTRPGAIIHGDYYASAEPGKEMENAEGMLAKYPNSKAILATGSPGTMAMLKVLDQHGLGGKIKFVGFGFNLNQAVSDALEKGTMQDWIAQLPRDVGYRGVEAALSVLHGEPVDRTIYIRYLVISRLNLHEEGIQALLRI